MIERVVAPSNHIRKEARIGCEIVLLQIKMVSVPIIPRQLYRVIHQGSLRGVNMKGRKNVAITFGCMTTIAREEGILIDRVRRVPPANRAPFGALEVVFREISQ